MELPKDISDYLRKFAPNWATGFCNAFRRSSPSNIQARLYSNNCCGKPFPAQKLAIMGTVKQME